MKILLNDVKEVDFIYSHAIVLKGGSHITIVGLFASKHEAEICRDCFAERFQNDNLVIVETKRE